MDFQFAANSREKVSLQSANSWLYQNVYPKVFDSCHVLMFDNFAKPDEVRLTQGENGEIEEEYFEDLENTFLFERMRETLIYMTHIDMKAMGRFIHLRLQNIKNPEYFSMERLNKLCWALGSISGCMPEDDENAFVVSVIKELLNMCEHAKGKSQKAFIATDIMYVVGSFPNFLCGHWAFLKTVINKLIDFMRETHPGVQDMASETFLKLAKLTKHMFVQQQEKDKEPYLLELVRKLPSIINDLQPHQTLMVYEGLGWMVSAITDPYHKQQQLVNLMQYLNVELGQIIQRANMDVSTIYLQDTIKKIDQVIKTNIRVADSVGPVYFTYLQTIFNDVMQIYKTYSNCISQAVGHPNVHPDYIVKPMRAVRRNSLKLVQTYLNKEQDFTMFG